MSDKINLTVIGAGTMGNGIVQTFAMHGHAVTMIDVDDKALERGKGAIQKSLGRFVKKEQLRQEQVDEILGAIATSTQLDRAVAGADLVIEAVFENEAVKTEIFHKIDAAAPAHAVLASNTSSISITRIANATKRPEQVIGMHFMNPVPLMKLVEIIRGERTSEETLAKTVAWSEGLGKVVGVAQDYPGFIANRILMPMINEAAFALMEGVGTREAIDTTMKFGCNFPMGPLTLADFIGLDICVNILDVLHQGLGDPKYRCCPMLRRLVEAGKLGRKSGEGFYSYE
ncbi:MAG: 3-hydroxybutyryl-CoA dehydrogenase [Planctomycetes bacterium]|nr:3-hydroxybutyryl-CoA dehydrogenase [Planctomycetota bacterium]MBL7008017.1 3-hydroxybutyryl-CoA dehydrogenase [Planctomycetota bacterium]